MASVYLETTIISYLASKPSRDIVTAGHQQSTHDWWDNDRHKYECVISNFVLQEIAAGNPQQAARRQNIVQGLNVLQTTPDILHLAKEYEKLLQLPPRASADAVHLAIAITYQIEYLMTWNMKHLCSTRVRSLVEEYNETNNLFETMLCTPEELIW